MRVQPPFHFLFPFFLYQGRSLFRGVGGPVAERGKGAAGDRGRRKGGSKKGSDKDKMTCLLLN